MVFPEEAGWMEVNKEAEEEEGAEIATENLLGKMLTVELYFEQLAWTKLLVWMVCLVANEGLVGGIERKRTAVGRRRALMLVAMGHASRMDVYWQANWWVWFGSQWEH